MNIVPTTRTVVDYACTFSEQDIQLACDDPHSFGEKFREQLLALDPPPAPDSNGHAKTARQRKTYTPGWDHPANGKRKGARKQAARKAAPKAQKPLLQCPQCPKQFKTQGRLNNHLVDAHGETASASTNTWQKADAPAAES